MHDSPQIFLSYAREDEDRVNSLYLRLTRAGFNVWVDKQNLLPGQRWPHEIEKALKRSELVIVCLSHRSIQKRGFLQKEIRKALERLQEKLESDIYLIPARFDDCEVPDSLSNIEWADVFTEDGYAKLIQAIDTALGQVRQEVEPQPALIAEGRGIIITSPHKAAQVDPRDSVEGHVANARARVWVIVHPMDASTYWVQPPASVCKDGNWEDVAFFGRQSAGDEGKRFEIMAVADPEVELREGMVLDGWPAARARSQVIKVTRRMQSQPSAAPGETLPRATGDRNVTVNSASDSVIITGDGNTLNAGRGVRPAKKK